MPQGLDDDFVAWVDQQVGALNPPGSERQTPNFASLTRRYRRNFPDIHFLASVMKKIRQGNREPTFPKILHATEHPEADVWALRRQEAKLEALLVGATGHRKAAEGFYETQHKNQPCPPQPVPTEPPRVTRVIVPVDTEKQSERKEQAKEAAAKRPRRRRRGRRDRRAMKSRFPLENFLVLCAIAQATTVFDEATQLLRGTAVPLPFSQWLDEDKLSTCECTLDVHSPRCAPPALSLTILPATLLSVVC